MLPHDHKLHRCRRDDYEIEATAQRSPRSLATVVESVYVAA